MTKSTGPRAWTVFAVTSLGAFLVSLDLSIVNVAFPALTRSFPEVSRAELSWVITAYAITFGSLLVIGGRTGDRLGLRKVFFAGLGAFSLGSALCGAAPAITLLIAGRTLQGAGAAFMLPSAIGLLLASVAPERRSQTVTLFSGVGALAVATGPSFGSLLVAGPGWRAAFYINLPVALIAYLWGRKVLPEPGASGQEQARPDYLGAMLLAIALSTLTLGISQLERRGLSHPLVWGGFVATPLFGTLFIRRSARHPSPVLDLSLFQSSTFRIANMATLAYAMSFFAVLLANILFLTGIWHYSITQAGLAVTPGPLVVAAVSGFAGRMATRHGFRAVLMPGAGFLSAALLWFAWGVGSEPAFLTEWLPGTVLLGVGIGLSFPVLSAAAVSSLPPARFGVGSAVNQTARQVGGAVGVAIMVSILGEAADRETALRRHDYVWLYSSLMALISGAVASRLKPLHETDPSAATAPTATPAERATSELT